MDKGLIDPKVKKKFNVTAASKHFAALCKDCKSSNQVSQKMKSLLSPRILWQGERIQAMKSVQTASCKLCMVERIEIRKALKLNPELCLNQNNEIYGQCTCAADFHLFKCRYKSDTEDAFIAEKSPIRKRLSQQTRPKKKPKNLPVPTTPITPRTRCKSKCWEDRIIHRPNRSPLIDINVPGVCQQSPKSHPLNMELARLEDYMGVCQC